MRSRSAQFGAIENGLARLLGDLDHRIRNSFTMIESSGQAQALDERRRDHWAKLVARITGLYDFYELKNRHSRGLGLAPLLEQTMRPIQGQERGRAGR